MVVRSRKGIGEVNACFIAQVVDIRAYIRRALHGCIVCDLVSHRLHILIQSHEGHHIHSKHEYEGYDHDRNGNVDIGFAFFVEELFHHPNIPPREDRST